MYGVPLRSSLSHSPPRLNAPHANATAYERRSDSVARRNDHPFVSTSKPRSAA